MHLLVLLDCDFLHSAPSNEKEDVFLYSVMDFCKGFSSSILKQKYIVLLNIIAVTRRTCAVAYIEIDLHLGFM